MLQPSAALPSLRANASFRTEIIDSTMNSIIGVSVEINRLPSVTAGRVK